MDDLRTLRELYGEPQADPFLKARVRRRVESAACDRPEEGVRRRPAIRSRRPPGGGPRTGLWAGPRWHRPRTSLWAGPGWHRPRLPRALAMAGLTAVAGFTAVVVAVTGTTAGGPGTAGTTEATGRIAMVSGRSVLLAAASTAASERAGTGTYWRVRKLHRQTRPEPLGRGENRYRLVESRITEQWVARDGRVWSGTRTLGARPASGADEEAWRRDGSPAEWADGGDVLSTSAEAGRLTKATGKVPFSMAGRAMTVEQIQGLPTEAAALKDRVSRAVREEREEREGGASAGSLDGVVADALSGLLWSKPSPPAVRAAAYRALAELPNVRYLGEATDELGRRGAAFSFVLRASPSVRRTLIIDPGDSQVLSSTVTGLPGAGGDRMELVLAAGWTDDEPAAPGLP